MAYNINKSNSDPVTIPSGAIDNQFDIPLIGQDAINYGDDLALAFVRLLENFANTTEPAFGSTRTTGQLWYDTGGTGTLNVYDGASFVPIPKLSEVVPNTGNTSIAGNKTFSGIPNFNGGTSGATAPFIVDSNFLVTNLNADQLDGQEGTYYASVASTIGREEMYIAAKEMWAESASAVTFQNLLQGAGLAEPYVGVFADGATNGVQFSVSMPRRWNRGDVTYQLYWTSQTPAANNVVWEVSATSVANTVDLGAAFGAAISTTSGFTGTVDELVITPESALVTVNGSPSDGDQIFFRIIRNGGLAGDTLAGTAYLLGMKLIWTSDQANDA